MLERELINRENNQDIEDKICLTITEACKNVNVNDAPKMDNEIFVDGQPVKVGKDGSVDLNKKDDEL